MRSLQPPRYSLFALAAWCIFLACGGIDKIDIVEESSATLPGATLLEQIVGDLGFGSFLNMDISQNEELKNQGVEKNQIDSVHVTGLTLTITDAPSEQDFTFIESLKFYIEAEGLERELIASGGPFDPGVREVELEVTDVDLGPYAVAPSMNVTTEVSGRRPRQETRIEAQLRMRVDIDVSGIACGN